jgi:outer membrane receptor protein involved in Fe transport
VAIEAAQIAAQGLVRVEDVVSRLPQAYVDQGSTVNNGATGTATIDLRQLGAERTLVLLDGKRLMPGDPTSGSIAPDLNFVPAALIDRIEVVTGGASAVYGSDAIAGVVNIILNKDFHGLRLDAQGGFYDHTNDRTDVQALLTASHDPIPPSHVDDGWTGSLDLAAGVDTPDGKGSLAIYGGYRRAAAVTEAARDFSACQLAPAGDTRVCSGSSRSPALGSFQVFNANMRQTGSFTLDPNGPGDTLRSLNKLRDAYNNAPYQYLQRPDVRWTAGGFARYHLSPRATLYLQGMFMDDSSVAQLAPSGLFGTSASLIACSDPLLSAAEVQAFCTQAGRGPSDQALVYIGRRNVEGGPRNYVLGHRDWRLLGGVKGEAGPWSWDVSGQYGAVRMHESVVHEVSVSRASDALDVVDSPSGQAVCASGNAGCVPYDVFQIGGVTQAALDYISVPVHASGSTGETVLSAVISGDLGRYGLRSPWAHRSLGAAFGAEYRRESLSYAPDAELASGDLASSAAAEPPVSGAFHVVDAFAELRAPLAEDLAPWLRALNLEAGVRYSRYSTAGGVWTYKAGAEWVVSRDVTARLGFNHAVRAPNVVDLFTPQTISQIGLETDPCAGDDPVSVDPQATPENCARTGVQPGQYGHIAENPEGYNTLKGGNPKVGPETANTLTAGVVLTPRRLSGLHLAVDWYDIRLTNMIDVIGADAVMEECLQSGEPSLCGLIHRAPATGSLWFGGGYVTDTVQNIAALRIQGVDVEGSYRHDLPRIGSRSLGSISLDLAGSYVLQAQVTPSPLGPSFDCAGLYGTDCGTPLPRWRHMMRIGWSTPWSVEVEGAWRYIGPLTLASASSDPVLARPHASVDARIPAHSYFDLSLAWTVRSGLTFRFGANNVLDQNPAVFSAGGNGNTSPGLYDALGRYVFAGLSARF